MSVESDMEREVSSQSSVGITDVWLQPQLLVNKKKTEVRENTF